MVKNVSYVNIKGYEIHSAKHTKLYLLYKSYSGFIEVCS